MKSAITHPLVRLQSVDVDIAGAPVLRQIEWELEPRTFWAVLGANGSGKSTFLALVAGLAWPAPQRGARRYDFGNGIQTDAVEAHRQIALLGPELQDRYVRLGWNFTAEAVVLSGVLRTDVLRAQPSAADKVRAHALLSAGGLTDLAERRFLELSRGEQRRVLIARSLAFRPSVLLLDEPASGLDREARSDLDVMLARIAATTTIVCAGHDADEVPSAASHVLRLAGGRIVAQEERAQLAPASGGRLRARFSEPRQDVAAANQQQSRAELAPTDAPAIEVEHADVWLKGRRVLRDVCWRLGFGEHWHITGKNGAGKSTFLKLLHGQVRAARGGIVRWPALGFPQSVWQVRRAIGYVSAELQAEYRYAATVRQCVASGIDSSIGLTRSLSSEERDRVDALVARFALTPLADRQLTTLSHGQRHCVLLARTLVNTPRVLLLDEPWEGLDQATRTLVHEQIEIAIAGGTQVVCASHVGGDIFSVTHEATIDDGRLSVR